MYKSIFYNRAITFKSRVKNLLCYFFRRRGARILWHARFNKVFELYPDYKISAEKTIEKSHILYWKSFQKSINLATMRLCKNISGVSDPRFIPEEIFMVDIEPTLNQSPLVEFLTYKSFYNHWFPKGIFPQDYFHNIDGEWFDKDLNPVTINYFLAKSKEFIFPVVLKPNRDSYGGKNIYFPESYEELSILVKNKKNFLIQAKINQHSFFEQFNSQGLNTLRVYIYRSVANNQLHIINITLRMGVGGSLDNETAGGIVAMVRKDGFLNGYAVDKYGKKYTAHPDTQTEFNQKIPDFENLKKIAHEISSKIFYARLIGLDLCYDTEQRWRMIEINIFGATIRFAQYHGALFFDEFTDEVRDYCLRNHWTNKKLT